MKKKPPFPPKAKKADEMKPPTKPKGRGKAPRGGGFLSGLMKM